MSEDVPDHAPVIRETNRDSSRFFLAAAALTVVAVFSWACGDAGDPMILGADRDTESRNTLEITPSEIVLTEGETMALAATVTGPSSRAS